MDINIDIDVPRCVKSLSFFKRKYPLLSFPSWVSGDPLERLKDDQHILLKDGIVVWGHIIQANELMFTPGNSNAPGEIVYDPHGHHVPEQLAIAAQRMGSLKGRKLTDPALQEIGDYLANEMIRVFGKPVPDTIAQGGLRYSTILFNRAHLPNGYLAVPFFPVIISDQCPGAAMILPSRWWPRAVTAMWKEE
jgi:hypothetical protein